MNVIKSNQNISRIDELKHIRKVNIIFNKNSFDIINLSMEKKYKYKKLKKLFSFLNKDNQNNVNYGMLFGNYYSSLQYTIKYKET